MTRNDLCDIFAVSVQRVLCFCCAASPSYIPGYDTCKSWCPDATEKDTSKSVKVQQCHISFDTEQGERAHG
jgi:hypothetical protein